jgi:hypothetical protein
MNRHLRVAGFPARFLMLARDTFEASVAIHYHAPWTRHAPVRPTSARDEAA